MSRVSLFETTTFEMNKILMTFLLSTAICGLSLATPTLQMDSTFRSALVIIDVSTVAFTDNALHGNIVLVDAPLFGILSHDYRKECMIHTSDATPDVVDQLSDFENNNNDFVNVVDERPDALPAPCIYYPFISKTELDPGGIPSILPNICFRLFHNFRLHNLSHQCDNCFYNFDACELPKSRPAIESYNIQLCHCQLECTVWNAQYVTLCSLVFRGAHSAVCRGANQLHQTV